MASRCFLGLGPRVPHPPPPPDARSEAGRVAKGRPRGVAAARVFPGERRFPARAPVGGGGVGGASRRPLPDSAPRPRPLPTWPPACRGGAAPPLPRAPRSGSPSPAQPERCGARGGRPRAAPGPTRVSLAAPPPGKSAPLGPPPQESPGKLSPSEGASWDWGGGAGAARGALQVPALGGGHPAPRRGPGSPPRPPTHTPAPGLTSPRTADPGGRRSRDALAAVVGRGGQSSQGPAR